MTTTETMNTINFELFFSFKTRLILVGPQSHQDIQQSRQKEQQISASSQNQKYQNKHRQRKEDGRTTNIVPNIFKALIKSKKNIRKDLLNIYRKDRPKEWTMKAEIILLCLKYRETQFIERQIFTKQIANILDKMIQFRTKKIYDKERILFNQMNRNLLETIKRVCLWVLNREAMPQPDEIKSILTELMKGNEENQGSLVVQSLKITQGFDYIVKQFPIYYGQIRQDKDYSARETTKLTIDRQKQQISSSTYFPLSHDQIKQIKDISDNETSDMQDDFQKTTLKLNV